MNQGAATAANASRPSGCSSASIWRQRPCASSHGPITRAGSTTPIKPFASIASAHSTQPATSQRSAVRCRSSSARASASTAAVIRPPTSMSWFAYWAPMKKNGVVASTPSATAALRGPCQRRIASSSAAPINHAPTAEPKRPAKAWLPSSCIAPMSSQ